jgi:hypothetical protein
MEKSCGMEGLMLIESDNSTKVTPAFFLILSLFLIINIFNATSRLIVLLLLLAHSHTPNLMTISMRVCLLKLRAQKD